MALIPSSPLSGYGVGMLDGSLPGSSNKSTGALLTDNAGMSLLNIASGSMNNAGNSSVGVAPFAIGNNVGRLVLLSANVAMLVSTATQGNAGGLYVAANTVVSIPIANAAQLVVYCQTGTGNFAAMLLG